MDTATPYIIFALANILLLQTWLIKRSFTQEKNHDLLKQAVAFYVENAGKGAAILLNTPNPAPEHIRPLLVKFSHGQLVDVEERQILLDWARSVAIDLKAPRSERGIAYTLVAAIGALKRMPRGAKDKEHVFNTIT